MVKIRTDAIRIFQQNVNAMNSSNQRDMRLNAQEARNLSNELSQLTALLVELQNETPSSDAIEVNITGNSF
jgi:hypothetical protein